MPERFLGHLRMELRLQFGPVHVIAAEDERVKLLAQHRILQKVSQSLKMPADLVLLMTLHMTGIVTRVAIATADARQRSSNGQFFLQLAEVNGENTGILPIGKRNPQFGVIGKQGGKRL